MVKNYRLEVDPTTGEVLSSLRNFFAELLAKGAVDALLIPQELSTGKNVVQTLVRDPEGLKNINPLAFVLPVNSARLISKLTDQNPSEKLGVVLRACEIRAMVELIKLKQINNENLLIIGVDCFGTFSVMDYAKLADENKNDTIELLKKIRAEKTTEIDGYNIRPICTICDHPIPENADILIGIIGVEPTQELLIQAMTERGVEALTELNLTEIEEPQKRIEAISAYLERASTKRSEVIAQTLEGINSIPGLLSALSTCIKCYNCRDACPICYCKECVFDTPTLNPAPPQYMAKAKKKGVIRMPMDTLLYHITRMNHMIISCVGCGQCESACPNDIPVARIFIALGKDVQKLFDYIPGINLDEELPLASFKEEELASC